MCIMYLIRTYCFFVGLVLSDDDKKKYTLLEIEKLLRRNCTSLPRLTSKPKLQRQALNILMSW